MLQQIGDPFAILLIRLPPRHCFDVLRIHQQHLKLSFQKVPHLTPPTGGTQHTCRHTLLVNIQTATDFMYNLHRRTPSAASRRTSANYRNSLACSLSYDRGNSSLCPSTPRSYSYSGSTRARISRP